LAEALLRRWLLLAASAALLAGCGSSGNSRQARELLNQAFARPVGSATVTIELSATLTSAGGSRPFELSLAGPYRSNGGRKIPSFAWALDIAGGPRTFSGQLVSTGDDLFVTAGGTSYDVGAARVAQANAQLAQRPAGGVAGLGIDPHSWIRDATVAGPAQIAGTATTHVRASIDVAKLVGDLRRALARAGGVLPASLPRGLSDRQVTAARNAVHNPTVDVYVAKADGTLRRLAIALSFTTPPAQFGGVRSGFVSFSVELANIGQPVTITPPANAQPLGGASAPGSTPSPQKLQAYSRCLQQAGSDPAALQRCAALLR
jgi:hypothetical protein